MNLNIYFYNKIIFIITIYQRKLNDNPDIIKIAAINNNTYP